MPYPSLHCHVFFFSISHFDPHKNMSSRLSHGLQTCLEPSRVTESRVLRLILAPPMSGYVVVERMDTDAMRNGRTSGWNFIEALSNSNTSLLLKEPKDQEQVYIHPSVKRSRDHLSQTSLEMCTESLGSETGSNIMEGNENVLCFPKNTSTASRKNINRCGSGARKNKLNQSRNFPPPLSSMTGATGFVRVKPHREAGKLVLKAVSMPSSNPLFHAERANGRLTLQVVKSERCSRSNSEETRNEAKYKTISCEEEKSMKSC